jgi:hypothetical protein
VLLVAEVAIGRRGCHLELIQRVQASDCPRRPGRKKPAERIFFASG